MTAVDLETSYHYCEEIAAYSGSSFFRSFAFLRQDRRKGMFALYAFARILDDYVDESTSIDKKQKSNLDEWRAWLELLTSQKDDVQSNVLAPTASARYVGPALRDTMSRFSIPTQLLLALIDGVEGDLGFTQFNDWDDLNRYCYRVASTVGLSCLCIWSDDSERHQSKFVQDAAIDCGIAFQLTNILRDLHADAALNRIYIPTADLRRFGLSSEQWLDHFRGIVLDRDDEVRGCVHQVLKVYVERAKAYYESGWRVFDALEADGQRMFSLMWHTYRKLLYQVDRAIHLNMTRSMRLTTFSKIKLAVGHVWTPFFRSIIRSQNLKCHSTQFDSSCSIVTTNSGPPRVAVIGGGLAGINTAIHLARHGCEVQLYEARSKLGGRAGSFWDKTTDSMVDYCQHVGMACCTELLRWIELTRQQQNWQEIDQLHFYSKHGKHVRVKQWPLLAPFHLLGLLFSWPDLSFLDRLRVAYALGNLKRVKFDSESSNQRMIDWLRRHGQTDNAICCFWETILVSALGEQIERVTVGPARKVLVDGFISTRRGHRLLVPTQPLSRLIDDSSRSTLQSLGVQIHFHANVESIQTVDGRLVVCVRTDGSTADLVKQDFDRVIVAVPWHRIGPIVANLVPHQSSIESHMEPQLESSPITGIHTWWDRAWLTTPHAILIDRLCQWIFPGPLESQPSPSSESNSSVYYQIVISGSRSLPRERDAIIEVVLKELRELFPEVRDAELIRVRVVTDPNSVFSVDVGHEASRWRFDRLSNQGVFIAGDWTDTGWPATMESALRSGIVAAEGVLDQVGRSARIRFD